MEQTLLEKAKEIKIERTRNVNISEQEIKLYLAVFSGEITPQQARKVLFPNSKPNAGSGRFYSRSFVVLRQAYENGNIKIIT